jgi:hypothetical protein
MLLLPLLMGAAAAALPILMRLQWERLPPPGYSKRHATLLVARG